ncbi:peptidyl-tRNA hydrolase [Paramormyrops kingsleyae]|uniref:peptidyl-tRNA hydrolase n=1 Tax=Paramormyrops kingsleyae TaxID=1676925 RepID=A0A3B3RQL3_9TELE|nr:probable peptidyl-tRNA hydrolase [Paramormyrops kingsleyae]
MSGFGKPFSMANWFRTFTQYLLLNEPFTQKMSSDAMLKSTSRRRMVVGLGNPGMSGTRHSVGMAVLAAMSDRLGVSGSWRNDKHVSGEVVVSAIGDTQLVLLRPSLLMNINGVSVAKAASKYRIQPEDIFLVHDNLDKPMGKFSIKRGGSARGHNGVRSCVECLQTDVMPRLLIGIGRPVEKALVIRHVLGRFSKEEQKVLCTVLSQSVDLLLSQFVAGDQKKSTSPSESKRASLKKDIDLQHSQLPPEDRKCSEPRTDLDHQSEDSKNMAHRTDVDLQCSQSPPDIKCQADSKDPGVQCSS